MFVKWINRCITHNQDKVGDFGIRLIIHIPIGFLCGLLPGLKELFIRYEENEEVHSHDQAWKDYAGAMYGFIPGRAILIAFIVWLIFKLFL